MNNDQKPLSVQRDEERMKRALPTRDAIAAEVGRFGLADRKANEGDARIREHKIAQLQDLFQRAKGRPATDAEIAAHLGEPNSAT